MEQEIRFIVTFYDTQGAMAFQTACETRGVEGRLIPIPRALQAGCGMAWSAPLSARVGLMQVLDDPSIEFCERTLMSL